MIFVKPMYQFKRKHYKMIGVSSYTFEGVRINNDVSTEHCHFHRHNCKHFETIVQFIKNILLMCILHLQ